MGKSWKRRQQRLRNQNAKQAVDNILSTTASMSQTIAEVINTMKPTDSEIVTDEPVVPVVTPVRKRRTRTAKTTTTIDSNDTTD